MTQFDSFIKKLFEEGLGNMGPKVGGAPSAPQSSSSPSSSSSMKPIGSNVNSSNQNQGGDLDVQNVMDDPTTKWKEWLTKPYNSQALNTHVMGTMFDANADPQQKNNMINTINKNPELKSYYDTLVNNMSQQQ